MWILAIIFILAGGGLFYASLNVKRKLQVISGVETSHVADLQKVYREVTKEIGNILLNRSRRSKESSAAIGPTNRRSLRSLVSTTL
jgi:hypothetical protein